MYPTYFNTLEEIPEADRQHYRKGTDGRYVLELEDQHPVVVKNKELVTEVATKKGAATKLAGEKAQLEAANAALVVEKEAMGKTNLPAGHKAVPEADAELLDKYKLVGTPAEVATAKAERDRLKAEKEQEASTAKREADAEKAGALYGYTVPSVVLMAVPNDAEFVFADVDKDGKKVPGAKVKFKEGDQFKELPLDEFIKAEHPELLPALRPEGNKPGTRYPRQKAGEAKSATTVYDQIRADAEAAQKQEKSAAKPIAARLGRQ